MIYKHSTTYYRKAFEVSPPLHNADGRLILIQTNLQMQNLVYPRHMSNNPSNNPTALSDFVPCLCRFRPLSFSCKCKSSRFAVMTCPSRRFVSFTLNRDQPNATYLAQQILGRQQTQKA